MKRLIVTAIAVAGALVALAADTGKTFITLKEAGASISKAVSDAETMQKTMSSLSNADQVAFVAQVNKAIAGMSGSAERKTAAYLAAAEAALKAAAKSGNLLPVLAEIFATVPPGSLTVLQERFAAELFNRAGNSSRTYTDAQVLESSKKVMSVIHAATSKVDQTEVRDALAIAMLVNASNGTPKNLAADLISVVATDATRGRMTELVMAAIAGKYAEVVPDDEEQPVPNPIQVLRFRDAQLIDALEGDINDSLTRKGFFTTPLIEQLFELDEMDPTAIDNEGARPLSDGDARFNPDAYQGQSR